MGTREILVAGRYGVEIDRQLDEVRLTWWGRRWTPKAGRNVFLLSMLPALPGFVGTMAGFIAIMEWGSAPLAVSTLLAGLLVSVAPIATAGVIGGRPVRSQLRITSAGVSVDEGPLLAVGPDTEVHLVVHERGDAARASEEVVAGLAAQDSAQARAAGQLTSACGVDLVIGGKTVPVARKIDAQAALALKRALSEHLPIEPSALEDTEGMDELRRIRGAAKLKSQG